MKWLAVPLVLLAVPALAQTTRNQAAASGAAGVQSRLQSQGYAGVHDLRRMPDGQWIGKGTMNGSKRSVTVAPNGTTIAR